MNKTPEREFVIWATEAGMKAFDLAFKEYWDEHKDDVTVKWVEDQLEYLTKFIDEDND